MIVREPPDREPLCNGSSPARCKGGHQEPAARASRLVLGSTRGALAHQVSGEEFSGVSPGPILPAEIFPVTPALRPRKPSSPHPHDEAASECLLSAGIPLSK